MTFKREEMRGASDQRVLHRTTQDATQNGEIGKDEPTFRINLKGRWVKMNHFRDMKVILFRGEGEIGIEIDSKSDRRRRCIRKT